MPQKAVRIAEHEGWSLTPAGALDHAQRRVIDCANILAIYRLGQDTKGFGPGAHLTGGSLRIVGVLVIMVVFAHVDDREFPQRRHIHHFVQHSLAKRAITKEAHRHLVAASHLARHSSSGGQARASPDDSIGAKIARVLVSDMHAAALTVAVAGLLANIEMCNTRHFSTDIQLVDMLFENTNLEHLLVHGQPQLTLLA